MAATSVLIANARYQMRCADQPATSDRSLSVTDAAAALPFVLTALLS